MRHSVMLALLLGCGGRSELPDEPGRSGDDVDATLEDAAVTDAASQLPTADAAADASSAPLPCSERPDACPLDGEPDSLLWGPVLAAKQACDARFSWQCGELRAPVGADGCVTEFWIEGQELPAGFADCVLRELSTRRYACAASTTQRSYESCTIP